MDTTATLPEEIILKILTHLPAKPLHRFKCVSKHWLSVLTSPHFIKAYLTLSPPSWVLAHRRVRNSGPNTGPKSFFSFTPTQPPNVSHLTITGFPRDFIQLKKPGIHTSSNGLVLLVTDNGFFCIVNPVTTYSAVLPLPACDKRTKITAMGMAVKFTPSYDDVSLVLVNLLAPPKYQKAVAATLTMYNSDIGEWETRAAKYKAGSRRDPQFWKADTCVEVKGRLFWIKWSCGLLVLDDPFGERMELRFIPLPEGHEVPHDTPDLARSRMVSSVGGFVQYYPLDAEMGTVWRLIDVEKGEWRMVFKAKGGVPIGLPFECEGPVALTAYHPLEDEVAVLMDDDKSMLLNLKENKLVGGVGACPSLAEDDNERPYCPLVIPPWPTPLPRGLEAMSLKCKGNFYFDNKYFKDAIECYSRSICCLPTAAAYANRAAAHLQLGKYQEAENDCSKALKLDSQYMKVYARRASARKELGKLLEAKDDVEMALKLDGGPHQGLLKLSSEINCLLEKETAKGVEDAGL